MKEENLEEKIGLWDRVRSSLREKAGVYMTAALLTLGTAAYGCGESYCCEKRDCDSGYNCEDVDSDQGGYCIQDNEGKAVECCECVKIIYSPKPDTGNW